MLVASLLLVAVASSLGVSSHEKRGVPTVEQKAKRVLVISLDGLDARYLQKRDEYKLRIPNLRRLMAEGVMAGVQGVYPSVTYSSHMTIVTGVRPIAHGIYGNEIFEPPNMAQTGRWQWFANEIKADTLWDAARRRGLKTAMVSWPVAGGAGDYNFPEIWKPRGSQQETLAVIAQNTRPAGLVQEAEQHDPLLFRNVTKDEGDDMRTRFAEYIIAAKRPEMMLIHLLDLDHFQHDYGPFTAEAFAMLEKMDEYVGRILAAAERADTLAETAVFIVTDHGFLPITKLIHPGVLLERAGLVTMKEEKDEQGRVRRVVTDWRAAVYPTAGSCAIILRDPGDKQTLKKLREIFTQTKDVELVQKQGRIFRVLDADEVRALGTNPRAALMLEAADGYSFGSSYSGKIVTESKQKGTHGYLPARYEASFIASGAGVGRRGVIRRIQMVEIGPTIARSLGLTLRNAEKRGLSLR